VLDGISASAEGLNSDLHGSADAVMGKPISIGKESAS